MISTELGLRIQRDSSAAKLLFLSWVTKNQVFYFQVSGNMVEDRAGLRGGRGTAAIVPGLAARGPP